MENVSQLSNLTARLKRPPKLPSSHETRAGFFLGPKVSFSKPFRVFLFGKVLGSRKKLLSFFQPQCGAKKKPSLGIYSALHLCFCLCLQRALVPLALTKNFGVKNFLFCSELFMFLKPLQALCRSLTSIYAASASTCAVGEHFAAQSSKNFCFENFPKRCFCFVFFAALVK